MWWLGWLQQPWLPRKGRRRWPSQTRGYSVVLASLAAKAAVAIFFLAAPAAGQSLDTTAGLLGEYFLGLPATSSCSLATNGSLRVLGGMLPNLTRRDAQLQFNDITSFGIDRCVWLPRDDGGAPQLIWTCRGKEAARNNFAVRWTGFIQIFNPGHYTFQIEADDGARLIIGNNQCPGVTCGAFDDVFNSRLEDLSLTYQNLGDLPTFGQHCGLCATGVSGFCTSTNVGCEPFSIWHLEADGATPFGSSTCATGRNISTGTRYMLSGLHPLKIEYFQRGGDARFILRYTGPDTSNGPLQAPDPGILRFPTGNAMRADWFELPEGPTSLPPADAMGAVPNGRYLRSVTDTFVDTSAGGGGLSALLLEINRPMLLRWTGFLDVVVPGLYTFSLESDDGSRLVLAGRGGEREQVVVDNDGLKPRPLSATGSAQLLNGPHAVRLEFFWAAGPQTFDLRPPGINFTYAGPDTGFEVLPVASALRSSLRLGDPGCSLRSWSWAGGLSASRDCVGTCIDGKEMMLGDGVCDVNSDSIIEQQALNCSAYNFDNGDCAPREVVPVVDEVPVELLCYTSCPAGDFRRRSCSRCTARPPGQSGAEGYCMESLPYPTDPALAGPQCCVAHVSGIESWGSDCIAFGTTTNCSDGLASLLADLRNAEPTLYTESIYDGIPLPVPSGYVQTSCTSDLCNAITQDLAVDSRTGRPTGERVCPVQESPSPGVECYEGPWDVDVFVNPLTECQGSNYENNFCKNRRTMDGRPFVRCCATAFLTEQRTMACHFFGLPEHGSCLAYLRGLSADRSAKSGESISNLMVLTDGCLTDGCNDPKDPATGCLDVIDEMPWQVVSAVGEIATTTTISRENVQVVEDEGPWLVVGLIVAAVLAVGAGVCAGGAIYYLLVVNSASGPTWHSKKAKVISDSTWIEPEIDIYSGAEFGVVKPRPRDMVMEATVVKAQRRGGAIAASPATAALPAEPAEGEAPGSGLQLLALPAPPPDTARTGSAAPATEATEVTAASSGPTSHQHSGPRAAAAVNEGARHGPQPPLARPSYLAMSGTDDAVEPFTTARSSAARSAAGASASAASAVAALADEPLSGRWSLVSAGAQDDQAWALTDADDLPPWPEGLALGDRPLPMKLAGNLPRQSRPPVVARLLRKGVPTTPQVCI